MYLYKFIFISIKKEMIVLLFSSFLGLSQKLIAVLILVRDRVLFGWTMFLAWDLRQESRIVTTMAWGVHNCGHGEDVSISCIPSKNNLILYFCWKHQVQNVCTKNHAMEQHDLVVRFSFWRTISYLSEIEITDIKII